MNDEAGVFGFERDFAGALRCIPMAVRFRLDHVGIKLSLRQWSRFSHGERAALLQAGCADAAETTAYRHRLVELVGRQPGEVVTGLTVDAAPAWAERGRVPALVADHAAELGLAALPAAWWSGLTDLQRFTLLKLSRDSHDNVNFIPALREFGLQGKDGPAD